MRSKTMGLALLAVAAGSFACERPDEHVQTGQTRTTSGSMEQKPSAEVDRLANEERTKTEAAKADADRERERADACESKAKAKTAEKSAAGTPRAQATAKSSKKSKSSKPEASAVSRPPPISDQVDEEPVGTTTITSGAADQPHPAQEQPTAQPPASEANDSTTLGSGTSGMYTGNKGTYGGKATWGTGARPR